MVSGVVGVMGWDVWLGGRECVDFARLEVMSVRWEVVGMYMWCA